MKTFTWYVIKTKAGYMGLAKEWRDVPFDRAFVFRTKQGAFAELHEGDTMVPLTVTMDD